MGARHRFRLSIMGSLTSSDLDFQPETEEVPGQESGMRHLLGLSWQQLSQSTFPSVWVRLLGSHLPPHFPAARRLMSNVCSAAVDSFMGRLLCYGSQSSHQPGVQIRTRKSIQLLISEPMRSQHPEP